MEDPEWGGGGPRPRKVGLHQDKEHKTWDWNKERKTARDREKIKIKNTKN